MPIERENFRENFRRELEHCRLEELTDRMQDGPQAGEPAYWLALAELERRKTTWQKQASDAQIEAAKAAIEAAEAAKKTAEYAKRNARYMLLMLLSVIAIFLTAGLNAVFQFLTWAQIRPPWIF